MATYNNTNILLGMEDLHINIEQNDFEEDAIKKNEEENQKQLEMQNRIA